MKTQFYFPAPVEVVKVTNENLAEVAEWCGGKVAATESRRVPGRMDSYVWVPTPKGNAISWAFPGMFITKRLVVTVKDEMKATYAVFRKDYFSRNYFDNPTEAVDKTWEKNAKKKEKNPSKLQQEQAYLAEHAESKKTFTTPDGAIVDKETGVTLATPDPRFRHNHVSTDECGDSCEDPDTAGVHIFNDIRITNEKENDMERSKHGYPVLTEEEAAERKADAGITMEQAVETVKEVIPGSEVIETTDLLGSDIESGEALETPEATPKDFAEALTDTQDEYREALDKLND